MEPETWKEHRLSLFPIAVTKTKTKKNGEEGICLSF